MLCVYCIIFLFLNKFFPVQFYKRKSSKMSRNQPIGKKIYRNKRLQRHILALRTIHTETLLETKKLKLELKELWTQFKNGNKKVHDRICQISEDILINKEVIQEQKRMLKMYKQKNADFHRRYHDDIVQRKKYIAGILEQQPIDLKKQIQFQKAILKNKIQLNPKTSSLTVEERLVLADKQHKLKKQLRDYDWNKVCLKRQIYLQKVIAQNKIQLNEKTSSLTVEERLVLADKQHKLKKQLRDHNWSGAV